MSPARLASDGSSLEIALCGERVQLLAARAAYWARGRALFIADVHLGKSASFRSGGVPVPRGSTAGDLARLSAVIESTSAAHLFVLGDFIHAASGRVSALNDAFNAWRERHRDLAITLVRGNHDSHAGDPPASWNVPVVTEPHPLAPFLLCHMPAAPPSGYALCGHLHPGTWVSSGIDSARLPCFVVGRRRMVLPAFGSFTGLAIVAPRDDQQLVAIGGRRLFVVPNTTRNPSAA
ncbi:MAG: ligase-associated DNA damage response endonuclease PdeM [Pseudomonadota bacterium]|nr:ligase-associated DNA damage response endonuclease PdeM [Pseudomonadota bacterium]